MGVISDIFARKGEQERLDIVGRKSNMEFNKWLADYNVKVLNYGLSEFKAKAQETQNRFNREDTYVKRTESMISDPNKQHLVTDKMRGRYEQAKAYLQSTGPKLDQAEQGLRQMVQGARKQYDREMSETQRTAPVYSTAKYPSPGAIPVKSFRDIPELPRRDIDTKIQETFEAPSRIDAQQFAPPSETAQRFGSMRGRQEQERLRTRSVEDLDISMKKDMLQGELDTLGKQIKEGEKATERILKPGMFQKHILPFMSTGVSALKSRVKYGLPKHMAEINKLKNQHLIKLQQMEGLESGYIRNMYPEDTEEIEAQIREKTYQDKVKDIGRWRQ